MVLITKRRAQRELVGFSVQLERSSYEALCAITDRDDCSLASLVRRIVRQHLEQVAA